MMTLLASAIGFIGSLFPELLKLYRDKQDRTHELTLLQLQLEQQKQGVSERLEEIRIATEASESTALYQTYRSGVAWVDALSGTVRPVLAYGFFVLYAVVKGLQFSALGDAPLPWQIEALWSEEDRAIFAGILSFYFGQRAMGKLRAGGRV